MNTKEYYLWVSENSAGRNISESEAAHLLNKYESSGIEIIDIESELYPDSLRYLSDPPCILYCMGEMSLISDIFEHVAVVGTRRASPYGKWVSTEIGRCIALCSCVHISGMAEGIDAFSHRAVLEEGGKSLAVLGTGVDVCYPKSSRDIYEELKKHGLIISEFVPGSSGRPSNFPKRNRIISGLSNKVVIVEGALKSGSMITARLALDQGKEIYAVPGNINQPNSIGPNRLIEDGAIPIVDPSHIADTLGIGFTADKLDGLAIEIYDFISKVGSLRVDDIINEIKVSPENVMAALTVLELKSLIFNDCGIVRLS